MHLRTLSPESGEVSSRAADRKCSQVTHMSREDLDLSQRRMLDNDTPGSFVDKEVRET
jgi:hypothetical protein